MSEDLPTFATGPSRRELLASLLAGATLSGCAEPPSPAAPPVSAAGTEDAARGHRVREAATRPSRLEADADVVIVGAGVAGLSAAWRLRRGGFTGTIRVLELGDQPGGTAVSGEGPAGAFPWGAHYVTLPSPNARAFRAVLADLGVITGFAADGRPRYDETALALAPQQRVLVDGVWLDDLWPARRASQEDERQRRDFEATCATLNAATGADGLHAFAIPVAHSSRDPAFRALADVSFAAWCDQRGYTSPILRWLLEYACRDDYGTRLEETSAWAGLHYWCSRRADPADLRDLGTEVLTWPAGNGHLVGGLLKYVGGPVETGVVVRRVAPEGDGVELWAERGADSFTVRAKAAILAVPSRVADRLLDRAPTTPRPNLAPWRVAQITVETLPSGRGIPFAWESTVYGAPSVGYVNNQHQRGMWRGPAVLTWFEPLHGAAARAALLNAAPREESARILDDLALGHPDLRDLVRDVTVRRWGHGTAMPAVGLHSRDLVAESAFDGPIWVAHADLSGISLFEEANHHGTRAAEAVLRHLGVPLTEELA